VENQFRIKDNDSGLNLLFTAQSLLLSKKLRRRSMTNAWTHYVMKMVVQSNQYLYWSAFVSDPSSPESMTGRKNEVSVENEREDPYYYSSLDGVEKPKKKRIRNLLWEKTREDKRTRRQENESRKERKKRERIQSCFPS